MTQSKNATPDSIAESALPPARFGAWVLLLIPLLFVAIRCVFAPLTELCGDEAYYWVWSRQLAWGYLDHPPMVAWLIRLSCSVLGASELGVRLPAILLAGATMLLATWAGHLLSLTRNTLLLLQVILLCFPMLHVEGAIITPDTPALFFVMLMLVAALLCLRSPHRLATWVLLAISAGGAMFSKYTALLPVASILLFLLIHSPRQWYRPVLSGLFAAALISPMLYWNYQRNWLSFAFQFRHGTSPDERGWYLNLGDYIAGQAIVATPLLMPLLVYCGVRFLRKSPAPGHRLVAITALVSLMFFAATSLLHKVEANWPTLAWIPLIVLLVAILPTASASLRRYAKAGVIVAAIATLVLMLPPAFLSRLNKHSPLNQMDGWGPLAREIRAQSGSLPIVCARYQDASLFSFYLPGNANVPVLHSTGARLSFYDYIALPDLRDGFLLVTDDAVKPGRMTLVQESRPHPIEVLSVDHLAINLDGVQRRGRFFAHCRLAERDAETAGDYIEPLP